MPAIVIYRIGSLLYRNNFLFLSLCFSYLNRLLFSVWLPSSCTIGKNLKIGYGGLGIVIHDKAVIGDNCLISQNVTIGRNLGDISVPIIGNDVYIGTGSVIFGEITIGNNVIIGANSVVNKSITSNCTVVGNPFKVISIDRKNKFYEIDRRS
jgi:serine O-acetyltransferase